MYFIVGLNSDNSVTHGNNQKILSGNNKEVKSEPCSLHKLDLVAHNCHPKNKQASTCNTSTTTRDVGKYMTVLNLVICNKN